MAFSSFQVRDFYRTENSIQLSKTIENVNRNSSYQWTVPPEFHSRLCGPSVIWRIFRRLQSALEFVEKYTKDAMVFSFEEKIGNQGQRLFLVTHPKHMWLVHRERPVSERCSYEVIQEGKSCKLYFDLEFCKISNPDREGVSMTKVFIKCVTAALMEMYDINCVDEYDVLWLDSSTEKKFSSHLIFLMKKVAFKDNGHAGRFVTFLIQKIDVLAKGSTACNGLWPSAELLEKLFVLDKNGEKTLFCDKGVYTKNRNFRLFMSVKYKKNVPLLLSPHNKYVPVPDNVKATSIDESVFLDSLITYFRYEEDDTRLLECCPLQKKGISLSLPSSVERMATGCQSSPYPEIDAFILSLVANESNAGCIRRWTFFPSQRIIIFDITNYRYCGNIGRHHRSNNIMFVVELKNRVVYQKCYDPVCKAQNYKSEVRKLPECICLSLSMEEAIFSSLELDDIFDPDISDCMDIAEEEELELVRVAEAVEKGELAKA